MGAQEDYAAAVDHESYVRGATNDKNQWNIAAAATERARQRMMAAQNGSSGNAQADAIAKSNPLYSFGNWLMGGK